MSKYLYHSHQKAFFNAPETFVGLFGGVGNGKTLAGCIKIIELSTKYPDNLCLVGRLTYPELRDSTREVFIQALTSLYGPSKNGAWSLNKAENSITFWNGSNVIFRHLDEPANILSMNLGAFYIDQAEEVDEEVFLILQSRLRRQNVAELKGFITGNPKGHNWVYYKFGMGEADNPTNHAQDQYRMITAPTIANANNLPKDYIDNLKKSYSIEWFNRFVMGAWDVFEAQIFDVTQITGYDSLPEIKIAFTAIDPAISKEKSACNTAFCTIGVGADGHMYDLETIAGKWSFLETLEECSKVLNRQKPEYLGVEDVAYQKALYEACQRYFPKVNVLNLKADRDKYRRAKSVSHIVAKGLFHTNNKELLDELSAFVPEQKGKERKDRVDAMVHALHMVQQYAPTRFVEKVDQYKDMTSAQKFFHQVEKQEKLAAQGVVTEINYYGDADDSDPSYY